MYAEAYCKMADLVAENRGDDLSGIGGEAFEPSNRLKSMIESCFYLLCK